MCHIRGTTCPTLEGWRRVEVFSNVPHSWHYVSNPRGLATSGNLFRSGCIHNRNVSDPEGSATSGISFKSDLIRSRNLFLQAFLFELFSSSFSLRAFQVKSSQVKPQLIGASLTKVYQNNLHLKLPHFIH